MADPFKPVLKPDDKGVRRREGEPVTPTPAEEKAKESGEKAKPAKSASK
jgi:hypothetical protein